MNKHFLKKERENNITKNFSLFPLLLLLLLLLFFFPFINSTQVSLNGEGLEMIYPPLKNIQQGQDYTFNTHVKNSTNFLTNSTISCNIALYSNNGSHIYESNMIFNAPFDFSRNIEGSNFTSLGTYSYAIICNSSSQTGFISDSFGVTTSENYGTENITFIIFIILMTYLISFVGFFGKNEIVALIGGMFMMFLGIYLIQNGIIIYRDNLTLYFSYLTIGLGAIFSLWSGIELITD